MIPNKIKTVALVLVTISLEITSHHVKQLTNTNDNHPEEYFAKILQSLVKLNDERLKTINKLHSLNENNYLKQTVRTRPDDYDEIIKSIKLILDELQNTNEISDGVPDFFRTKNYYYIKRNRHDKRPSVKAHLRDQSSNENKQSDDISSEALEDNSKHNNGANLRYNYYYSYSCGRARIRCKRACNNSYKLACYYWKECPDRFRREMRKSCRRACSDQFDDYYD